MFRFFANFSQILYIYNRDSHYLESLKMTKLKKPTVLLDCDGVLADFTSLALQFIENETGKLYKQEDIPHWEIFESLGYPELWSKFNLRAGDVGFCSGIKPYRQAMAGVKKLRNDCEILIVTAPVDALPWMYERAHWLEEHFDISRKKVIFAHEKQHVRGDMLVDDKPDNVFAWAKANPDGVAVLWAHPYNRSVTLPEGVIRTSNWKELHTIMKEVFR